MMKKQNRVFAMAMALTLAGSMLLGGCFGTPTNSSTPSNNSTNSSSSSVNGGASSSSSVAGNSSESVADSSVDTSGDTSADSSVSGNAGSGKKTILYVKNYGGGFGVDWIENVEKRFEAEYANVSFVAGETGVDVRVDNAKEQGENTLGTLGSRKEEVYFPGNIYYHTWVKTGKDMLDITDVVTGEGASDNVKAIIAKDGGKTILSKMTGEEKEFYNVSDKYYAIPHHNSIPGIVYDIDLFEEKELYIAADGGYTGTGAKSNGPDGKAGTSDDGLPATYEEFYALCTYMTEPSVGVTPFLWMGNNKIQYTDMMLTALMTDYEGVEQTKLNYTHSGTATNLIDVAADGTITKKDATAITPETAYQLYHNAGRYYALEFFEKILKGDEDAGATYLHEGCTTSMSLQDTHDAYLLSSPEGMPIAFMPEGNWWENESNSSFDIVADSYGEEYSKLNRNFGFLPLPKATSDKVGEEMTYTVSEVSLGFIKHSISADKVDLAKTFLAYCYTDESLNEFTKSTGLPAALQYDLDESIYNSLSTFGKQMCDIEEAQLVKPLAKNDIYNLNNGDLNIEYTFRIERGMEAITELLDNGSTAVKHFRKLCDTRFTQANWAKYL